MLPPSIKQSTCGRPLAFTQRSIYFCKCYLFTANVFPMHCNPSSCGLLQVLPMCSDIVLIAFSSQTSDCTKGVNFRVDDSFGLTLEVTRAWDGINFNHTRLIWLLCFSNVSETYLYFSFLALFITHELLDTGTVLSRWEVHVRGYESTLVQVGTKLLH